jgi:thioredoxin-dependent peroxiredoxin
MAKLEPGWLGRTKTMNRTLAAAVLSVTLAGALAPSAQAALPVGATAPDFTVPATLGGHQFTFKLADALKKGPVVLYFYPAAFTTGCTIEAHAFAAAIDQYKALHATVIGVSHDDIAKLDKFSVSECQSKFPVAADPNLAVAKSYDSTIALKSFASRTSYVIAPDGKVIYAYSDMNPNDHVSNTLDAVKAYQAKHG